LALTAVHTLALFWRRRHPRPVLALNLLTGIAIVALGMPMVVLGLAPLVAVYSAAASIPKPASAWVVAAGLVALALTEALSGFGNDASTMIGNVVGVVGVWFIGTMVHDRTEYVRALEVRTTELQKAREELAVSAVREERVRIARELHDVVAHSLSMISVQSTAAAHVIDDRPADARRALSAISDASHTALDEMRRLLGVLRDDGYDASRVPAPRLSELEPLLQQVRAAGPEVETNTEGEPVELPPGLDLTAYRIVQESLTNVIKHARAERVTLTLTYAPDDLVIEIVDDGRARATNGRGGLGIEGMRERAAMFGGALEAGPVPAGGYRVEARLPLRSS
jgi:signal transduction histidine kinase